MGTELIFVIAGLSLLFLVILVCNIRIVKQSDAWVMERLGVYSRTWHTGLHIKIPFIEKRRGKPIDLREQILVCGEGFNHGQYHNHKDGYFYAKRNSDSAQSAKGAWADIDQISATEQLGPSTTSGAMGKLAAAGANAVVQNTLDLGDIKAVSGQLNRKASGSAIIGQVGHSGRSHARSSQPVITKDNVSMEIDTVVFYQITDPKLFAYGHAAPLKAVEHLVATSIRNIVGGLELDETLTSRELINGKIRTVLDEASDAWGIKITRVELRNIIISDVELAEAMEKQMIAERTKRAQILLAEGESQSKILEAEGKRKFEILLAEGKAEAIRLVNEAKPSQEFLTIRALEAYEAAANGQATKIIVPSEIQSLAGLALSGSEIFKEGEKMEAPHVDVVD